MIDNSGQEALGQHTPEYGQIKYRSTVSSALSKTVVAMAGASLIFEQSPANEALRTNIAFDVLEHTSSASAVGLTVAGLTAAIEFGSAAMITAGLHSEENAVQRLKNRIKEKNEADLEVDSQDDVSDDEGSSLLGRAADLGADMGLALGVGAGVVTIKHHLSAEEPNYKDDLKVSAAATGVVSGVSGTIGYLVAGGINHADGTIFEVPAEYFVDYASDTKFWMGVLAVGYGVYYAKKGIQKITKNRAKKSDDN